MKKKRMKKWPTDLINGNICTPSAGGGDGNRSAAGGKTAIAVRYALSGGKAHSNRSAALCRVCEYGGEPCFRAVTPTLQFGSRVVLGLAEGYCARDLIPRYTR